MRLVHPPKLVLVRRDDRWYDGEPRAWRRGDTDWCGYVCYATSPGMCYLEWVDAGRVREGQKTAQQVCVGDDGGDLGRLYS